MPIWVLSGFRAFLGVRRLAAACGSKLPHSMWVVVLAATLTIPLFAQTTVVYDGAASKVTNLLPNEKDLWLTHPDLTRVSGFELKPQGACLGELCVPIPKARKQAFERERARTKWFNLSELARTISQPEVQDAALNVRVFGPRPELAMKLHDTLQAPEFTLPDWKGWQRSLSEFRGKKVLLITWASW